MHNLLRKMQRKGFFSLGTAILTTIGTGCNAPSPATSPTACDRVLAYAGPTGPGTFAGLGEDAAQCQMNSWREAFTTGEPDTSIIFMAENCGQGGEGSLDKPFCTFEDALEKASQLSNQERTPSLYLDPGSYALNLTLKKELPVLEIRGLCSETTSLSEADPDRPIIATDESVHTSISLQGLTLQANQNAVLKVTNGEAVLTQVGVVASSEGGCFEVVGSQAAFTAEFVAIDGGVTTILAIPEPSDGGSADIPSQTMPVVNEDNVPLCIHVHSGGQLVLEDFYLHDFSGVGILVTGAGSRAELSSGVISGMQTDPADYYGYGASVEDGATATLSDVTLADNGGTNLLADGDGTSVTMEGSFVGEARPDAIPGSGVGLVIQNGAQGEIASTLIEDNANPGISLSNGSTTTARDLLVTGNGFAGITVTDAVATISDSSILGEEVGVFLQGWTTEADLTVTFEGNVIEQNQVALYAIEQIQGGMTVTLEDNLFHDSSVMGAAFLDIPTGITLTGNCFWNSFTEQNLPFSFGWHLILHASNALLTDNIYQGTYDAVTIQQQLCELLPDPSPSPYAVPVDTSQEQLPTPPDTCLCTCDTVALLEPTLCFAFDLCEASVIE